MAASLYTIGNTHLGKTGNVTLSELNTSDATTRTFSDASTDYKRVNSNEVARGHAPAPAGNTSNSYGTANSLDKWDGYLQWNASEEVGTNLDLVSKSCASASLCSVRFTFTRPAGYTNFHQASVHQQLLIKECTEQAEECWDDSSEDPVDPLTGTVFDEDGSFTDATCDYNNDPTITHNANANIVAGLHVSGTGIPAGATISSITDSTHFELSASTTTGAVTNGTLTFTTIDFLEAIASGALDQSTWYIGTVRMQWNDEETSGSPPYTQTGEEYTLTSQSWPTYNHSGADQYPNYPNGGNSIIFQMPKAPVCTQYRIGMGTTVASEAGREEACIELQTTTTYGYKNNTNASGTFTPNYPHNTVYGNANCNGQGTTHPTGVWIAVAGVSYPYSSGTISANPSGDYTCPE